MEIRWTYPKISDRARSDAELDEILGVTSAYRTTINILKKSKDIELYEYKYNLARKKLQEKDIPRPTRKYKGRSSNG